MERENVITTEVRHEHGVSFLVQLMHRWFVRYNPLYTASALCVLVGVFLLSDGLGRAEERSGEIWLMMVIELYELMLIAGAALLYRVARQRRPAVVLGLVAMVYMADVTFQVEVAGYLGLTGMVASAAWLGLFVVKLRGLAWALRLRLSPAAVALPVVGAVLVALLPHVLYHRLISAQTTVVFLTWLAFGLGAAVQYLPLHISSEEDLDDWGATVLRRAVRTSWAIWGVFLMLHMGVWSEAHDLGGLALSLCFAAVLLGVLRFRHEMLIWLGTSITVGICLVLEPEALYVVSMMVAAVLALKGRQGVLVVEPSPTTVATDHPYRNPRSDARPPQVFRVYYPRRLYVGAVCMAQVSLMYVGWPQVQWHHQEPWVSLACSAILLTMALAWRLPTAVVALAATVVNAAAQRDLLFVPQGKIQWGAALVVSGFAMLVVGLMINWLLRASGVMDGAESTEET